MLKYYRVLAIKKRAIITFSIALFQILNYCLMKTEVFAPSFLMHEAKSRRI
ncbi:MAG: hypothetical protein ACI9WT_001675, partial [Flavobacterium sp.]